MVSLLNPLLDCKILDVAFVVLGHIFIVDVNLKLRKIGHTSCKCDTIKGNESLVEKCQILVSYVTFSYLKMLHLDANPIKIGYLVTEL